MNVAAAQGVRGMSANAAPAIGIETSPTSVRWSELMAAGIRRAIAVSSRRSGSARKERFSRVWSITSPYPNAKRLCQPAHDDDDVQQFRRRSSEVVIVAVGSIPDDHTSKRRVDHEFDQVAVGIADVHTRTGLPATARSVDRANFDLRSGAIQRRLEGRR